MTVIGVSLCKNNADMVRVTAEHMLTQVDHVIVMDNMSTDGAREILDTMPITILDDREPGYYQSRKMTSLAKVARNQFGADWIVPFDSDEIWYSPFGTIKEVLEAVRPQWLVASADLYDHVTNEEDDPSELNPVKRIVWRRREKGLLPKVACRWRDDIVIEQGNHSANYSGGMTVEKGLLVVRHYPYRSHDQFISKVRSGVAAYAATSHLPPSSGAHWKDYGRLLDAFGEDGLKEVYDTWFHLGSPRSNPADVIYDPAPIYA